MKNDNLRQKKQINFISLMAKSVTLGLIVGYLKMSEANNLKK